MTRGKKIIITLISLAIIILLSLFFFIADYREKVNQANITRQQLTLLETVDIFTDTNERLRQLKNAKNNQAWLHLATLHGNRSASTAYQLAEYFHQRQQIQSAQLWYKVAIRQNHIQARIALANNYFQQQEYAHIKPLLLPIIANAEALTILYKVALYQGDVAFITRYKNQLANSEALEFYLELEKFSVFAADSEPLTAKVSKSAALTCLIDVQLFATNLAGLRHTQQLINTFQQQHLAEFVCLNAPKYIAADIVKCLHQADEKITCRANTWAQRKDINTRYLGLVVERGGANVDHGILYIDQNDSIDVLVHELSHLIGFVDEYPLPVQHQRCQQHQQEPFAHNLVVLPEFYQGDRASVRAKVLSQVPWFSLIKDTTPILSRYNQGWQLLTPKEYQNEIGLFPANSCQNQRQIQAFKPLAQRTKLQYFELIFPPTYIDILRLAANKFLMPSYHYNISRDLVELGDYDQAREVLQSTLFE
ncbi:MAG: hypothetical protein AXW17_14190 [Colwellia sp. Phe_37]|jgi:hypothetical protein|nr:MAG: hypothetical protein AXW17_14190 [Colwellia sp. Phe_37]|tara:strand:+ start:9329 stop:10765 length:1437 start_codon:yes stop_codon:yes gene_type:complete